MHKLAVGLILLAPVLIAQQPGAKTLDPCTLVSKAEVKEAVGVDVADPKREGM